MVSRTIIFVATVLGAIGVGLGAWGAHGLAAVVGNNPAKLGTWDTAVLYQFVHVLSLLFIGLWYAHNPTRWLTAAAVLMVLGVVLFSGSLYLLVLGGPRWLGPVTPMGGTLMIAGWVCAAAATFSAPKE